MSIVGHVPVAIIGEAGSGWEIDDGCVGINATQVVLTDRRKSVCSIAEAVVRARKRIIEVQDGIGGVSVTFVAGLDACTISTKSFSIFRRRMLKELWASREIYPNETEEADCEAIRSGEYCFA